MANQGGAVNVFKSNGITITRGCAEVDKVQRAQLPDRQPVAPLPFSERVYEWPVVDDQQTVSIGIDSGQSTVASAY